MNKSSAVVLSRLLALALVLFASIGLFAQGQNGVFVGTVTDPQGAAVVGAQVKITNQETGLSATAPTNSTGQYTSQPLPVGNYKFEVTGQGFKTATKKDVKLDVGVTQRLNFQMAIGQSTEVFEVTGEAALVQVDDAKLANQVGAQQIANLPLNGRNVYDLIRLTAGAQDVRGVVSENGANAVVNGLRENFNGFMVNGVSNKGLSGGNQGQPIEDSVQEFQLLTLNNSAQYGNSAGSLTNLVTKGGTNSFHGSVFEFLRNDALDANDYFNNNCGGSATGCPGDPVHPKLRFNQFGATLGGPIIKDKLFFYGAYQGDRFITSTLPSPVVQETAGFRAAVAALSGNAALFPNGSVANLLYHDFVPSLPGSPLNVLCNPDPGNPLGCGGGTGAGDYFSDFIVGDFGAAAPIDYLCDAFTGSTQFSSRMAALLGVTAAENAALGAGGCTVFPVQAGLFSRTAAFQEQAVNTGKTRAQGNLFDGNEIAARIDWNATASDRLFANFNWLRNHDEFLASNSRGFPNPFKFTAPVGQFVYAHTFTPTLINEFKAGYTGDYGLISTGVPGVPFIGFDDASLNFGSYNGYPQFFKENIYNYSDMVSWTKGKHNIKFGADVRRNIENSEFNVGRPSYYFFDPLWFAADKPYIISAGIDPDLANGGTGTNSQLSTNIRHWRNVEFGAYFQDDWKITPRLTLQLGMRYDLFTRHNELNNLATTFIPGSGNSPIDDANTGSGWILNANSPLVAGFGQTACTNPAANAQNIVLAGVCGPGGFAASDSLGAGDHNNWGPRVGFAYDMFGNGKTSLRGGFGVSYESTLYNPLSNSRWNPPYYSFNSIVDVVAGGADVVFYGPQSGGAPSYTGPPDPLNHQGTGATGTGNINAYNPANPNQAVLTGVIFPSGIKDPYVYNYYLGVQHEFLPKWVAEMNYVGTVGHKLFRAENVNRKPGSLLAAGTTITDILGRQITGLGRRRLNQNYGRLRAWQNAVNSNYNALQLNIKRAMSHGVAFNVNYTWSHSIDGGSTWHSGATTANLNAAGEGFTTDQTAPWLDRSNSIFDIRHTMTANYIWELPFFKNQSGALGYILGGWQFNGIISAHTGAHWSPACLTSATSCDMNRDGERNDRPNSAVTNFSPSKQQLTQGWGNNFAGCIVTSPATCNFTASVPGNPGNEGRNTFVGPIFVEWNPSLFKNFKVTEKVNIQFRVETFNILNHTNFSLANIDDGTSYNNVRLNNFGQAGGTFNPRQMQLGLKISF